jgi:hypothetical protein
VLSVVPVAPHQLRHAHAVELLHEGIPLPLIQRQLGHSHPSTTGTYLGGIDSEEIISTIHGRRAPMMHAKRRARAVDQPTAGALGCAPANYHRQALSAVIAAAPPASSRAAVARRRRWICSRAEATGSLLHLGDRSSAPFGGRCRSSRHWDRHRCPSRTTASIRALARRLQAPDARLWRIRGLLDRAGRALPSCWRKHLPLTAFAWPPMSGSGSARP